MVVTLSPANVASDLSAIVKTDSVTMVEREAHLQLGLSADALRNNRFPTSYGAALELIEGELSKPTGGWERVTSGKLPVMLDAVSRDEIQRALALASEYKLKGVLTRAPLAGELAADVRKSGLGVIVGPFGFGTEQRLLDSVRRSAAVLPAFGLESPDWLEPARISAVVRARRLTRPWPEGQRSPKARRQASRRVTTRTSCCGTEIRSSSPAARRPYSSVAFATTEVPIEPVRCVRRGGAAGRR
jgi:hypothetical protein